MLQLTVHCLQKLVAQSPMVKGIHALLPKVVKQVKQ